MTVHVLALDTATAQCGVGLLCDDGRHCVRRQKVTTHSESVLSLVESCLHECALSPAELTGIACSAGPGSFTGLRIGLATAKGLCFALGLPLCLVSSLEALGAAVAAQQQQAATLVLLDAFRGQLFARLLPPALAPSSGTAAARLRQVYAAEPRLARDTMWQPAELIARLRSLTLPLVLRSATPLPAYAQPLVALAQHTWVDDDSSEASQFEPPPLTMARRAREQLAAGHTADLFGAVPNYLCGSAPEEAERLRLAETAL